MNKHSFFFLAVIIVGAAILGWTFPYLAVSFASDGAAAISLSLVVLGFLGLRNSLRTDDDGQSIDRSVHLDLISQWRRHAAELQDKLDRAVHREAQLPDEAEAIRAGIEADADAACKSIHSLLNGLFAFKATIPQLAARLEEAEAERDAARAELALVDDMQSRRRIIRNGAPRVADFAPPPKADRPAPQEIEPELSRLVGIPRPVQDEAT